MRRSLATPWLMRTLAVDRAMTIMDLVVLSGWSPRTIRRGLAELQEYDEAIRIALPDDPDQGTLPVVFMKTYDDYRMRVANRILRERAQPRLAEARMEKFRRSNEYWADMIRRRQARERRESDQAGDQQGPQV